MRIAEAFRRFVRLESFSGMLLLGALAIAMLWANSPWSALYFRLLDWPGGGGPHAHTLSHWINDGLMTLFFFVVGAEIKREFISGELADPRQAALPVLAALGGMAVPALIYAAFNHGTVESIGWGIPMATDIPFALGILALLGKRVPNSLRIFLMALAIIDDLGSIVVIAAFYTRNLSMAWMGVAAGVFLILFGLGRYGLRRQRFYTGFGILLWYALTEAGVHGTIAGVLTAWTMPTGPAKGAMVPEGPHGGSSSHGHESPLEKMVARLHPLTAYFILPLFAFVNSGIRIDAGLFDSLWTPVGLGVALGLAIGKPIGITGVCWAGLSLGIPPLSGGVRLKHLLGAGILGGIGFTMSIFISALAFPEGRALDTAKFAVIVAAFVSGIVGWLQLRWTLRNLASSGSKAPVD